MSQAGGPTGPKYRAPLVVIPGTDSREVGIPSSNESKDNSRISANDARDLNRITSGDQAGQVQMEAHARASMINYVSGLGLPNSVIHTICRVLKDNVLKGRDPKDLPVEDLSLFAEATSIEDELIGIKKNG
jgi:tryptophan synthase alpha subunit